MLRILATFFLGSHNMHSFSYYSMYRRDEKLKTSTSFVVSIIEVIGIVLLLDLVPNNKIINILDLKQQFPCNTDTKTVKCLIRNRRVFSGRIYTRRGGNGQ